MREFLWRIELWLRRQLFDSWITTLVIHNMLLLGAYVKGQWVYAHKIKFNNGQCRKSKIVFTSEEITEEELWEPDSGMEQKILRGDSKQR